MPVAGGGTGHILVTENGSGFCPCGAILEENINESINMPTNHTHSSGEMLRTHIVPFKVDCVVGPLQ